MQADERFGDRSFDGYRQRAADTGVSCQVLRLDSLVLDLDNPDDLRRVLDSGARTPPVQLLWSWGLR